MDLLGFHKRRNMKRLFVIFIILLFIFSGLFLLGENLDWFNPEDIEHSFSCFSGTFVGRIWTTFAIVGLLGVTASILGTLPICFVYSYFGNLGSPTNPWPLVWVSVIIPAIGWLITYFIKKR